MNNMDKELLYAVFQATDTLPPEFRKQNYIDMKDAYERHILEFLIQSIDADIKVSTSHDNDIKTLFLTITVNGKSYTLKLFHRDIDLN